MASQFQAVGNYNYRKNHGKNVETSFAVKITAISLRKHYAIGVVDHELKNKVAANDETRPPETMAPLVRKERPKGRGPTLVR